MFFIHERSYNDRWNNHHTKPWTSKWKTVLRVVRFCQNYAKTVHTFSSSFRMMLFSVKCHCHNGRNKERSGRCQSNTDWTTCKYLLGCLSFYQWKETSALLCTAGESSIFQTHSGVKQKYLKYQPHRALFPTLCFSKFFLSTGSVASRQIHFFL